MIKKYKNKFEPNTPNNLYFAEQITKENGFDIVYDNFEANNLPSHKPVIIDFWIITLDGKEIFRHEHKIKSFDFGDYMIWQNHIINFSIYTILNEKQFKEKFEEIVENK